VVAFIKVAVGVVINPAGNVLIAKRLSHQHCGGMWEFPGGKIEANESTEAALARELLEEVDITVQQAKPLCQVEHEYPEKRVLLDVWQVTQYTGIAQGSEGQEIRWIDLSELPNYQFPPANTGIVEVVGQLLP
tara:strand:+ start:43531 stop:43929 length:399 start_codon:yes stop_codon:yes gene_type:complete